MNADTLYLDVEVTNRRETSVQITAHNAMLRSELDRMIALEDQVRVFLKKRPAVEPPAFSNPSSHHNSI